MRNATSKPRAAGKELPCVTWAGHRITRLMLGHNPIKGGSHFSDALSAEMRNWHLSTDNGLALLRRAEACGINSVQFGGESMHRLLTEHHRAGGKLDWIATLYNNETGALGFGDAIPFEQELREILAVTPRPIGIQHFGERTDALYFEGKLATVRDRMKRLRDTGLLIGLCTHLPEVAEEVAAQDWDIDFYQLSAYTAYAGTQRAGINRADEIFEDTDRARMFEVVRAVTKPCIVFKVLGANRKCASDSEREQALSYAFAGIKESDVVCVGMWQKHRDQVGQNTDAVRRILDRRKTN